MNAIKLLAVAVFAIGGIAPVWAAEGHATKAEAMAMVKKAVAYIGEVGSDKAYAEIEQRQPIP